MKSYSLAPSDLKRFLAKFSQTSSCWLWRGAVLPFGHGRFRLNGRVALAHRVAYSLYVGDIPEDKFVLHKCDVPQCINPDHLFLGTKKDNTQDMLSKGRANGPKKLTTEQVISIREDSRPQSIIALEYLVHQSTIHYIKSNKTWRFI